MTNKMCETVCSKFEYNYFGTFNGQSCSCGNSFGSYNRAFNCDVRCSGNSNEFCGGKIFYPFSVYYSDKSKIIFLNFKNKNSKYLKIHFIMAYFQSVQQLIRVI